MKAVLGLCAPHIVLCIVLSGVGSGCGDDDVQAGVDAAARDGAAADGGDAGHDAGKAPALPDVATEWTAIEPGGETTCARGDEFRFFVRGGSVNKVAIVFDGGGACWDASTCSIADAIFSPTAEEMLPEPGEGISDTGDEENPFRDYYHVFIPYCTGDVHWGDNVKTYEAADGRAVTINHKGQVNTRAALDWVYERFEAPETIFVTGMSAGAYGSIGWAPHIIRHYPKSRVVQLADSGAGVITETFFEDSFPNWNAQAVIPDWIDALDVPLSELALEDLYIGIANAYPDTTFAQYNTHNDENQRFYYTAMGGADEDWSPRMRAKIDAIIEGAANFRSFIAGGEKHVVLPYSEFYTYQADGVRLRDWVADLAAGLPVDNVECDDCVAPSLYER